MDLTIVGVGSLPPPNGCWKAVDSDERRIIASDTGKVIWRWRVDIMTVLPGGDNVMLQCCNAIMCNVVVLKG